jgi:hypothetical protein
MMEVGQDMNTTRNKTVGFIHIHIGQVGEKWKGLPKVKLYMNIIIEIMHKVL